MHTEIEEWLTSRLKQGVKVQELYPHRYRKMQAYYELRIYEGKKKIILELKRKAPSVHEETTSLKIVRILKPTGPEKEEITIESLLGKELRYEQSKFISSEDHSPFFMTGTLILK